MRARGVSRETRMSVIGRDRGRCFRCGRHVVAADSLAVGVFWAWEPYSIHHRKPRGMGGTRNPEVNSTANLLLLCGTGTTGCHGWVESNREDAQEQGLLIRDVDEAGLLPAYSEYRDGWFNTVTGLEVKTIDNGDKQ